MKVTTRTAALKRALSDLRRKNLSIGFVPTMGYLHEGHLSLVRHAQKENDAVVASIFVNPIQFGPKEDFSRYPRDMARDRRLLESVGTDFLFAPDTRDFYPADFQTGIRVERLSRPLCGVTRPTHFGGVATVVAKLLNIVQPDRLYLGQKDFQQIRVIEQMVKDLDMPVKVRRCPIVREPDGVAMSSRNVYLTPAEREEARLLSKTLKNTAARVRAGERNASRLKAAARRELGQMRLGRLDYFEIVDAAALENVVRLKAQSEALAAVAVFFGKARLIDNILIRS